MPFFRRSNPFPTGYVRRKSAIADFVRNTHKPFLAQQNGEIKGSGEGVQVRLIQAYEKVTQKPFEARKQEIGDCVSFGYGLAVEILSAVEIAAGQREEYHGQIATEPLYALSRVEIGGGRIRGDGSTGAWAAKAVMQFGVVLRRRYSQYDLTKYRPDWAKSWGDIGCPDDLETIAREHPVQTAAVVSSAVEAADALSNGFPIGICSNQGFTMQTDKDGFAKPRGQWGHCMCVVGVDAKSDRPGFEIINSWGPSWISGPRHVLGTASGGFWADWDVVDRMLRQGDSHALSGFVGFPRRKIEYVLL